jgi:hypothetical protein
VRIFLWHVHGSWTTALVQGRHEYLVPVLPDRGPDGLGRARTYVWPESVSEVAPEQARELDVDVVLLQRPHELDLAERWLRGTPGRDVLAVYVEHSSPQGRIAEMRHPMADRPDLVLVHVAHFNDLFWDAGTTPTRVIEGAVVDPGHRYTGELPRGVAVINEPGRRGRVSGTDLLPRIASGEAPIDLFGMQTAAVGGLGELRQEDLHHEMARRRVYVHPYRWTSLGLSLLEAMHLGMPVVGVAATDFVRAVTPDAGVASTSVTELRDALRDLVRDPERAAVMGKAAREAAMARYGLDRFLSEWDALLQEVVG